MINWYCTCPTTSPIAQLIRRVADNDIESHLENLLGVGGVDELVSVAFERRVAVVSVQVGAAPLTALALPLVDHALENDVAVGRVKTLAHRVFAVRLF